MPLLSRKPSNALLALASGLLLGAAWYELFTPLIFIAWVPLLIIEDRFSSVPDMKRRKLKLTGLVCLAFLVWNLVATWWVVFASAVGASLAFVGNTLLMCAVFMIFHNTKRRISKPWAAWLLIPVWMAWEFGHTLWSLTWPWLSLGNAFAFKHNWVQWYEYTGASGGSLWALAVNILLFNLAKKSGPGFKKAIPALSVLFIPVLISYMVLLMDNKRPSVSPPARVMVVQPNIDPYNAKFYLDPEQQLGMVLRQLKGKLSADIDYLVLPETFITEDIPENLINKSGSIRFLRDSIIRRFPDLKIVTGASTFRYYETEKDISATARKSEDGRYYDYYNTALQIDSSSDVLIYHKSRLVPGAEQMPFPWLLKPLEKLALDFGGTTGSLGVQDDRSVFYNPGHTLGIAPVICYESIYGDFTTGYIRNGASLIFIITNDGWWEDTPGKIQHLNYARLRAIETRCPVARSANTGISCFIDRTGGILQPTPWWQPAVITASLEPNSQPTFFVRTGDILSRAAAVIAILMVAFGQFLRFRKS